MKTIKFIAEDKNIENLVPMPKPAKAYIPDWFKETTTYYNGNKIEIGRDFSSQKTLKSCIPILDVMTAGYIQETWQDLFIEHDGKDGIRFAMPNGTIEMVSIRDQRQLGKMPRYEGHEGFFLNWHRLWNPVLPKGYSAIYQHPAYMNDLPFTSVPAIVDADQYYAKGKVGFFIKKGFQGVIPAGTPMYQIIPFKREEWRSEKVVTTEQDRVALEKQNFDIDTSFLGAYKRKFWSRKEFN